jgi:hypothetical protein
MRFLGQGPAPVYQNRLASGTLDVWNRPYNNIMVGDPDDLKPGEHFNYPVFKGFYAGVRWLQLNTSEGPITALVDQRSDSSIYVQIFTPKTPPSSLVGQANASFPQAGVSFLHAIPAIGSKFNGPKSSGPMGQPAVASGSTRATSACISERCRCREIEIGRDFALSEGLLRSLGVARNRGSPYGGGSG